MIRYLPVLLDDVGSIVNFALAIGILASIAIGYIAYRLVRSSMGKKVLIAVVLGLLAVLLTMWIIINALGSQ